MMRSKLLVPAVAVVAAALGAMGGYMLRGTPPPRSVPVPSLTSSDIPASSGSRVKHDEELKLILLERFGPLEWCDPDVYPVGVVGGEEANTETWWVNLNPGTSLAVTLFRHFGIRSKPAATKQQRLEAYRLQKQLRVIELYEAYDNVLRFEITGKSRDGDGRGLRTTGTILRDGRVLQTLQHRQDVQCPVCLAAGTRIDTPAGAREVTTLVPGDVVWSPVQGGRATARVLRVIRRYVGPALLLRVRVADGRTLTLAAAHPLADGTLAGALQPGTVVSGARVTAIDHVRAPGGYTYDILTTGPFGGYFTNGIVLRSTLFRERPVAPHAF